MKRIISLLFIPQEKNNHKSFILHPYSLLFLIVFYVFSQSLINVFTQIKPGVLGYSSEITAQKVFQLTNLERQKNNLAPLHYNSALSLSSVNKAKDMIKFNYWAHNSPKGLTPWDFFKEVDYKYSVAGENLAKDFYDNEGMMQAWMNSPTHKTNIINAKYQEIGIGVVDGVINGVKTTLVVQHFATPLDLSSIKDITSEEIAFNSNKVNQNTQTKTPSVLSGSKSTLVSPLSITKLAATTIFIIILLAVLLDGFLTIKNNTKRLSGSTAGHFIYLLIIFILMIATKQGVIF